MRSIVIGGTGTLGSVLIDKLLKAGHEVSCFSRDELKQQEMKKTYPEVKFIIGDIRDKYSLPDLTGYTNTFHVAALKHVDVLENSVREGILTNVIETMNVVDKAIECKVKNVAFCTTDKAVLPINCYGYTKGLAEKYIHSKRLAAPNTNFTIFRWGNVIGSRGSVIPDFIKAIKANEPIKLTNPQMTRFWIKIDDAANFMMENVGNRSRAVLLPPMKACPVLLVIQVLAEHFGTEKREFDQIGIRPGEKIHECIYTAHPPATCINSDSAHNYLSGESNQYTKDEVRGLLEEWLIGF